MGVFSIIVQTVSLAELANCSWFRQAACAGDPLSLPSECWDSMFSTTSAQLFMWVLGIQTLLDKCFIYLAVSPTWLGHY